MTQVVNEAASGGYGDLWIANQLRRRTRTGVSRMPSGQEEGPACR
jgi:hypothetical protein